MEILSVGDQDYLEGKPIDYAIAPYYYYDGATVTLNNPKQGILTYDRGTKGVFSSRAGKGWKIDDYVLKDCNILNEFKFKSGKENIKLFESRDLTDRTRPIKEEKDRKLAQKEREAREAEENAQKARAKAEEQVRIKQAQLILAAENLAKENAEKNKQYEIKRQLQKEKDESDYRELEGQIITGMRTTETKVGDDVKYNGEDAKVIGKYFEILRKGVNGEDIQTTVKDDALLNITAAINKKQKIDLVRNPPRIQQSYGANNWQHDGGTRKHKKIKSRRSSFTRTSQKRVY